jgi:hypothetical protein
MHEIRSAFQTQLSRRFFHRCNIIKDFMKKAERTEYVNFRIQRKHLVRSVGLRRSIC